MRFASLGSGSRGNALVVEAGGTRVLIDCGFSVRETERRLTRIGIDPAGIDAILVTHEHGDHAAGVGALARRYRLAVWSTAGTALAAAPMFGAVEAATFANHAEFVLGALAVEPVPVPHDAREPCQFILSDGDRRLGVVTDVGRATPYLCSALGGCDALVLEFNHDEALLAAGAYPPLLKARVGGDLGHLSNRQAASLLAQVDTSRLRHFVAAHLSERNNTPQLARDAAAGALGCAPGWVSVADQDTGFGWREL